MLFRSLLWDSKEETVVNNESSEIIRMFNHAVRLSFTSQHRVVELEAEQVSRHSRTV